MKAFKEDNVMRQFIVFILLIISMFSFCACSNISTLPANGEDISAEGENSYYIPPIIEKICQNNDREVEWIAYYREDGKIEKCESYYYGGDSAVISEVITYNYDLNGKLQNAVWHWVDNEYSTETYDDVEISHCEYDAYGNLQKYVFKNTYDKVLVMEEFSNGKPIYREKYSGSFDEEKVFLEEVDEWEYDSNGKIINTIHCDKLNDEKYYTEYKYSNNLCESRTTYYIYNNGDKEKSSSTIYYYDSNNMLIKQENNSEIEGKECFTYKYEENGNKIQEVHEYDDGRIDITDTMYDLNNRITEEHTTFELDGDSYEYITYYQYDGWDNEKNRTIVEKINGEIINNSINESTSEWDADIYQEYYPNGNVRIKAYYKDGIYGLGDVVDDGYMIDIYNQ